MSGAESTAAERCICPPDLCLDECGACKVLDGELPCPAEPDAGDAEALAREVCPCTDDPNGTHVPDLDMGCGWALALCRAVLASDWLRDREDAARREGEVKALTEAADDMVWDFEDHPTTRSGVRSWLHGQARDRAARIAGEPR